LRKVNQVVYLSDMQAPVHHISMARKKGRKYDQVLLGAREVFFRDGFEGASVDDIAKAAKVSKATLYSYFRDKRYLFLEIAMDECRAQAQTAEHEIDFSAPARQVLTEAADRLTAFLLSDLGVRIFRLCVAESERFPEIGQAFYETGPRTGRHILIAYMQGAIARGELVVDDLELAAEQFGELCKADIFSRLVFGVVNTFTEAERQRVINGAVDLFLARFGTNQAL